MAFPVIDPSAGVVAERIRNSPTDEDVKEARAMPTGSEDESRCPFCPPRSADNEFWIEIADLASSTLYLSRSQTYRGSCLLVFNGRHVEGLEQLSLNEFTVFTRDLHLSAAAVTAACTPDLMNYASLGNIIRHLHWHIIPRYKSDPRWGKPVWTHRAEMKDTLLKQREYDALVDAIRGSLPEVG